MEKCDVNNIFEEKIVIYKCSDERYKQAYEELRKEHRNVSFWEQGKSLFNDVDVAISCCLSKFVAFFTDDTIFYNEVLLSDQWLEGIFEVPPIKVCNNAPAEYVSHISLRLGKNTQHRFVNDGQLIHQPVGEVAALTYDKPSEKEWKKMLLYDRSIHFYGGYWNYPISLDGHIFRQSTVQQWTEELCYLDPIKKWKQNPNELERALQRFCQECDRFVAIPEQGCVVNSPNNQVSDYFKHDTSINRSGDYLPCDAKELLNDFIDGYRINYPMLKKSGLLSNIIVPHQEINFRDAMIKYEWEGDPRIVCRGEV